MASVDTRLGEVLAADDRLMEKLEFVVIMLMAQRGDQIDTPRQACILPPWDFANPCGLSDDEQKPENRVNRLREWRNDGFKHGKGVLHTNKQLFMVCAHTQRLVPCGPFGHGYKLRYARKWVRVTANVTTAFLLKVACSTLGVMLAGVLSGVIAVAEEAVSAGVEMLEAQMEWPDVGDGAAAVDIRSQVWSIVPNKLHTLITEFAIARANAHTFVVKIVSK